MPIVYDYTFAGVYPGTTGAGADFNAAFPEWIPAPENVVVSNQINPTRNVIWNNRLFRPSGQPNQDPRDEILDLPILRTQPNNYEVGIEFGVIGTNFAGNHVAIIARQRNDTAISLRYRRDLGYSLVTLQGSGATVLQTVAQDLNPAGVSSTNNLRRRIRLRCEGTAFNCFVDNYDNTTQLWTVNNTAIISVTNTQRNTGNVGMILASASSNFTGATNGMYISRFYVDALGTTAIPFDPGLITASPDRIPYIAENLALTRLGKIIPIIH